MRNLGQTAPELVPTRDPSGPGPGDALYKVSYKNRDEDFWIDVDGHALDRVNTWLDIREWQLKHQKTGTIMEPLFVNGMIKVSMSDRQVPECGLHSLLPLQSWPLQPCRCQACKVVHSLACSQGGSSGSSLPMIAPLQQVSSSLWQ